MDKQYNIEKQRKRKRRHIRRHLESEEKCRTNRNSTHGHMIYFGQLEDHRGERPIKTETEPKS